MEECFERRALLLEQAHDLVEHRCLAGPPRADQSDDLGGVEEGPQVVQDTAREAGIQARRAPRIPPLQRLEKLPPVEGGRQCRIVRVVGHTAQRIAAPERYTDHPRDSGPPDDEVLIAAQSLSSEASRTRAARAVTASAHRPGPRRRTPPRRRLGAHGAAGARASCQPPPPPSAPRRRGSYATRPSDGVVASIGISWSRDPGRAAVLPDLEDRDAARPPRESPGPRVRRGLGKALATRPAARRGPSACRRREACPPRGGSPELACSRRWPRRSP